MMNGVCVFLNTTVLNDKRTLSKVGDTLLTPVRYLFNGANVAMTGNTKETREIHHVASFHKTGVEHVSRTNKSLQSAPKGMLRTAIAVVCLIPGLILGSLIKGLNYASSPVTKKIHAIAKNHFTPVSYKIGDKTTGIQTEEQLEQFCEEIRKTNKLNRPIRLIHIRAARDLVIHNDPGLLDLNPMKIVLEGGQLAFQPDNGDLLQSKIYLSDKWKMDVTSRNVEEAANKSAARRPEGCKHYHTFYHLDA